jgi:diguanylate cyclase (GGDEF)-like protein
MERRLIGTAAEIEQCEQRLHSVEGRERSMWITAAAVGVLLAVGLVAAVYWPEESRVNSAYGPGEREVLLRSLVATVLLFFIFAIYHRHVLQRLRFEVNNHLFTLRMLETRNQTLEELAIVDPVTGLFNRRYFNERIPAELARAERIGHQVAALAIDIDQMKEINDRYGHAAGDAALVELARRLRKAVRSSDSAIRMGGDEFLVVLTECESVSIPTVLSRLQDIAVEFGKTRIPLKFSFGWAQHTPGESATELCRRADEELYGDKNKRSSRVIGFGDVPVATS